MFSTVGEESFFQRLWISKHNTAVHSSRCWWSSNNMDPREIICCYSLTDWFIGSGYYLLHVIILDYSSTLKMKAICYFETSIDLQRSTLLYISVDRTLHNHICENLESHITFFGHKNLKTFFFSWWRGTLKKTKLRGFSLRENYTDRATAACWRSSANFCE
jgi:hypothetical protein